MATILILDDDLGSAFWLSQILSASSCEAVPAKSVPEAAALISRFKLNIDLVLLNPEVPGGADFTRSLRRAQGRLRVATLVTENDGNRSRLRAVRPVTASGS